jgi:hypothetical protein
MSQREMDTNLMVVAAVEGYSLNHRIPCAEVIDRFNRHGLIQLIRSHYEALHTQSLDESVRFAEDVMARHGA